MHIRTEFIPHTPGIYSGVSMSDYQKAPGVSKSALDRLDPSPIDYKRWRDGLVPEEQTEAMLLGTLHHSAIFEGSFPYYVKPTHYGEESKPWNGNATICKQWLMDHDDMPVVKTEQDAEIRAGTHYARSHQKAAGLLIGGRAELSCFAHDPETGILLKGRMDYVIPGAEYWTVVDLKTTADASTRELSKTIFCRRYHVQAAMYRRLLCNLGAPAIRFYIIALEPGELPKVNVRELNPRAIDLGDETLDKDIELLVSCEETNNWPEWRDDSPAGIQHIDVPEFAYAFTETLTGMTPAKV